MGKASTHLENRDTTIKAYLKLLQGGSSMKSICKPRNGPTSSGIINQTDSTSGCDSYNSCPERLEPTRAIVFGVSSCSFQGDPQHVIAGLFYKVKYFEELLSAPLGPPITCLLCINMCPSRVLQKPSMVYCCFVEGSDSLAPQIW